MGTTIRLVACDACDGKGWTWGGTGWEMPQVGVMCAACFGEGEVAADDAADDYVPTPAETARHEAPYGAACGVCGGDGFDPVCRGHTTPAGMIYCECPACDGHDHAA